MQSLKNYISDYVNETMSEETAQLRKVRDTAYRFLRNAKLKGDPDKIAAAQARYDSAVKAYEKGKLADKNAGTVKPSKVVMNVTDLAKSLKGMGWLYVDSNKYTNDWNGGISGFGERDGKLSVLVYWQNSSTDGTFSVTINKIEDINVPARNGHPAIRISKAIVEAAIQEAINKVNAMAQNAAKSVKNKAFTMENVNKAIKDKDVWSELSKANSNINITNVECDKIIDNFDSSTGEKIQLAELTVSYRERYSTYTQYWRTYLSPAGIRYYGGDSKHGANPAKGQTFEKFASYFN